MVEALRFVIRPGRQDDLPALEWDGEYRHYRALYRAAWEDVRRGERELIVAEIDGQVVGQIFVHYNSPWPVPASDRPPGYLYAFRVRPEVRGQGVGRALLREAEATLIRSGATHAVIAVARANVEARRLYERLGYVWFADDPGEWAFVDERGEFRRVHEPAHLLVKELVPDR